jgi:dipeptidyl aminopeptidase/acylaminoacyl peptidase
MVLQFGRPLGGFQRVGGRDEAAIDARGMEAAIHALAARGLIDPARVGLQGWSRTTYAVRYFLTTLDLPIAAALISDGIDYSYLQYLIWPEANQRDFERMNGGVPIGAGLRTWQERVPTLRADKITTPLRVEAMSEDFGSPSGGALAMWELFSLLRRLGRPVEMIYYPRGEHDLVHPQERLTSQGGAVDWFAFWLTGQEDPTPEKAAQYARWRAMRESRE